MQQAYWAPQIHDLMRDYRVITFDMYGHGASDVIAGATDVRTYSEQLLRLLDSLHIDNAHIVGHSLGGLVATAFAVDHPTRTASIAVLNSVFQRTDNQKAPVLRRAHALAQDGRMDIDTTLLRWFGEPGAHPYPDADALCRGLLESVNASGYAAAYMTFASADQEAAHYANLAMPALFATGDGDPNSTPGMAAQMAALAPQGEVVVLTDARHMMSLTHPGAVNKMIRTNLARTEPGRSTT
jgi:pimeloyl-ACP methyl ester carboxylesterase